MDVINAAAGLCVCDFRYYMAVSRFLGGDSSEQGVQVLCGLLLVRER